MRADVVVIGGGVIGSAIARELSRFNLDIVLIEKEKNVAMGSSKRNSGIIHDGYNENPGTLKARLNVKSNPKFDQLCKDLKVPFKRIGSLVIGFSEEDNKKLKVLKEKGEKNGISGLKIVQGAELFELEPHLNPLAKYALYAPSAGIISPYKFTKALAHHAMINGVKIRLGTKGENINIKENQVCSVETNRGLIKTNVVINAAGLYADEVAESVGENFTISPLKGEYRLLDKKWGSLVNHVLFPMPAPLSKGVLVTPTVHGNLLIGPSSYRVKEKNDLSTTISGEKEIDIKARKLIPHLPHQDVVISFAGLRANIEEKNDFIIEASKKIRGFINLAGIESPGLTSSPAIAEMVCDIFKEAVKEISPKLDLDYRHDFIETLFEYPENNEDFFI